jgi:hypothetical protein
VPIGAVATRTMARTPRRPPGGRWSVEAATDHAVPLPRTTRTARASRSWAPATSRTVVVPRSGAAPLVALFACDLRLRRFIVMRRDDRAEAEQHGAGRPLRSDPACHGRAGGGPVVGGVAFKGPLTSATLASTGSASWRGRPHHRRRATRPGADRVDTPDCISQDCLNES